MMKMQAQQQSEQMKMQATAQSEQARTQADIQIEQMKAQFNAELESQRQQHEAHLKMQELASREQFDRWKADLDAATKVMVARIAANPGADIPLLEAQTAASELLSQNFTDMISQAIGHVVNAQNDMSNMHTESMQKLHDTMQMISAPKRIVRGPDGRAQGVEMIPTQQEMPMGVQ
jgi:hypothetical protein